MIKQSVKEKMTRSLVVILAADGDVEQVLELVKSYRIKRVNVQQLAVPKEEMAARNHLIRILSSK